MNNWIGEIVDWIGEHLDEIVVYSLVFLAIIGYMIIVIEMSKL